MKTEDNKHWHMSGEFWLPRTTRHLLRSLPDRKKNTRQCVWTSYLFMHPIPHPCLHFNARSLRIKRMFAGPSTILIGKVQ